MATVKTFLDNFSGQSEAQKQAQNEIEVLTQMAKYKLDALEQQIKEQFRNKEVASKIEIVGNRLGEFSRGYRVNYQDGNISDAVQGIVNEIMLIGEEGAKNLIAKSISNALSALFASVGSQEEEKRLFRVTFEKVALVRYDFYVWQYSVRSDGLFKTAKSVVAYTYARSVVNSNTITDDELNDAIEQSMSGKAEPEQVLEYKKKLIDLWKVNKEKPADEVKKQYMALM